MLHEFLTTNRVALIDRCRLMVAGRHAPKATGRELDHGIPLFLDQLIKTLRVEQTSESNQSRKVSGPAGGGPPGASEIGATATLHGRELSKHGYTVDQVVHDYGDLCQAITALAMEKRSPIDVEEFRTLNRCLDNGIADAVTEYAFQRESLAPDQRILALNDRLGFFAHELRSLVHTATLAVASIKCGNVGITGATGAVLDKCLLGLRNLIDRSLVDVRITAGLPAPHSVVSLSDFVAQTEAIASLEARERECTLSVAPVDKGLAVDADLEMLLSAVAILLQNAFKFTQHRTEVLLHAYASADRILIDVEDHCGGLPPGTADKMIPPFKQNGDDKSGLGLGLTICRHSVAANNGVLRVRDVPGSGCVFTIDLPRHRLT
jgi:signal transduction histidine kinase